MLKKPISLFLALLLLSLPLLAVELSDQEYINQLSYKNNKLSLVSKDRLIDEKRNYTYTDVDTTTYSIEAFSMTSTDISTDTLSRSEVKEITDWFIYKGTLRKLSDVEFLVLINDQAMLAQARESESNKANLRNIGNIFLGTGILTMLAGTATSAGSTIITGGALAMTAGFFFNAFNYPPAHYLQPDYAQEKIDEYNINLKRKLNLPINYD